MRSSSERSSVTARRLARAHLRPSAKRRNGEISAPASPRRKFSAFAARNF
jgi:hypothetical protein